MQQKPFPFVLVVLAAALGWATFAGAGGWIRVVTGLGTLVVAAAAIYQSLPERAPEDPLDEDDLP